LRGTSMSKIFVSCVPSAFSPGDVIGFALAEDGTALAKHLSSSVVFSKHDMGITSTWHHDEYKKHYPDGYELEWIDEKDLGSHAGYQEAVRKATPVEYIHNA